MIYQSPFEEPIKYSLVLQEQYYQIYQQINNKNHIDFQLYLYTIEWLPQKVCNKITMEINFRIKFNEKQMKKISKAYSYSDKQKHYFALKIQQKNYQNYKILEPGRFTGVKTKRVLFMLKIINLVFWMENKGIKAVLSLKDIFYNKKEENFILGLLNFKEINKFNRIKRRFEPLKNNIDRLQCPDESLGIECIEKKNVWNLGLIFFQLFFCQNKQLVPQQSTHYSQWLEKVLNMVKNENFKFLLSQMLSQSPEQRLSLAQIQQILKQIQSKQLKIHQSKNQNHQVSQNIVFPLFTESSSTIFTFKSNKNPKKNPQINPLSFQILKLQNYKIFLLINIQGQNFIMQYKEITQTNIQNLFDRKCINQLQISQHNLVYHIDQTNQTEFRIKQQKRQDYHFDRTVIYASQIETGKALLLSDRLIFTSQNLKKRMNTQYISIIHKSIQTITKDHLGNGRIDYLTPNTAEYAYKYDILCSKLKEQIQINRYLIIIKDYDEDIFRQSIKNTSNNINFYYRIDNQRIQCQDISFRTWRKQFILKKKMDIMSGEPLWLEFDYKLYLIGIYIYGNHGFIFNQYIIDKIYNFSIKLNKTNENPLQFLQLTSILCLPFLIIRCNENMILEHDIISLDYSRIDRYRSKYQLTTRQNIERHINSLDSQYNHEQLILTYFSYSNMSQLQQSSPRQSISLKKKVLYHLSKLSGHEAMNIIQIIMQLQIQKLIFKQVNRKKNQNNWIVYQQSSSKIRGQLIELKKLFEQKYYNPYIQQTIISHLCLLQADLKKHKFHIQQCVEISKRIDYKFKLEVNYNRLIALQTASQYISSYYQFSKEHYKNNPFQYTHGTLELYLENIDLCKKNQLYNELVELIRMLFIQKETRSIISEQKLVQIWKDTAVLLIKHCKWKATLQRFEQISYQYYKTGYYHLEQAFDKKKKLILKYP